MGGDLLLTVSEDQDSLALFSCLDGQVLKFDATIGDWFCDTDIDTLGVLSCSQGQSAIYDEGLSGWVCGTAAGTLGNLSCQDGELAAFNNGVWSCEALANLFDQDGDGFSVWDDCDDADPSSNNKQEDLDCDGYAASEDCDNADPSSTIVADDADCDGILTADDCDDSDPSSTILLIDQDCDGALTADDCDDTDPLIAPHLPEICGDGIDNDCSGSDASCWSGPATFTTCAQVGRYPPTQSDCDTDYSGTILEGEVSVDEGIQSWQVPATGLFRIEVYGAGSGPNLNYGTGYTGRGAYLSGEFELTEGETLKFLVGQQGDESLRVGGPGGGTFVVTSDDEPLIVLVAVEQRETIKISRWLWRVFCGCHRLNHCKVRRRRLFWRL